MEKIKKARQYATSIGRPDLDIEIDGGVTVQNAKDIRDAGANVLVAGSTVFNSQDWTDVISKLKK